jgi:hypothetical protein
MLSVLKKVVQPNEGKEQKGRPKEQAACGREQEQKDIFKLRGPQIAQKSTTSQPFSKG